jgi:hypothetical protein
LPAKATAEPVNPSFSQAKKHHDMFAGSLDLNFDSLSVKNAKEHRLVTTRVELATLALLAPRSGMMLVIVANGDDAKCRT